MKLLLERFIHSDECTIGRLLDPERVLVCYILERPQFGEPKRIDAGIFKCIEYVSPKIVRVKMNKGMTEKEAEKAARVWWLQNVPGRSMIEIHCGNYPSDLKGCLAPGLTIGRGKNSVGSSAMALHKLTNVVGGWDKIWELEIVNV